MMWYNKFHEVAKLVLPPKKGQQEIDSKDLYFLLITQVGKRKNA